LAASALGLAGLLEGAVALPTECVVALAAGPPLGLGAPFPLAMAWGWGDFGAAPKHSRIRRTKRGKLLGLRAMEPWLRWIGA
jgi:hypothetical protein